jgi:predicted dehydrogenase
MKYKSSPGLLHVHTPQACLILSGSKLEVITEEGRKTLYEPSGPAIPYSSCLAEVEHFLACIQTGRTPLTDGKAAMKSHRLVWDIYGHQATPVKG